MKNSKLKIGDIVYYNVYSYSNLVWKEIKGIILKMTPKTNKCCIFDFSDNKRREFHKGWLKKVEKR